MAKKTETPKLSEKEMEKIAASQSRLNNLRNEFAREQSVLTDLVDVIGDRYGVTLVGPEATHQIAQNGQLVEAPKNSDADSKQLLTEDK